MKAEEALRQIGSVIPETGEIVVGLSGGADSVLLTHLLFLRCGPERVQAVHVHHGIRGAEADRDASFCASFCEARGIRFTLFRRDVPRLAKESGEGLEECARRVRYACLEAALGGRDGVIATAHNADDNAETVLLHLLRGAGPAGVSGIPVSRGRIVRPLLRISRADIESLCEALGLSYVTDSTNRDASFARNRLRLEVIPVLKAMNPRFTEAVSRFSSSMALERGFMAQEADALLLCAKTRWGLSLPVLREAHGALLQEALRRYAAPFRTLTWSETREAERCVRQGGCMTLSGRVRLEARQDTLTLTRGEAQPFCIPASGAVTALPDGRSVVLRRNGKKNCKKTQNVHSLFFDNALDCAKISCVPVLRSRREGDTFFPAGRGVRRSLRKLMNERRIPASLRDRVVLLEADGEIVWVESIGPAEGFAVTDETEEVLEIELLDREE